MHTNALQHQPLAIPTQCFLSPEQLAAHCASELAALIRERSERGEWTNLGLATGSSPILLYRALIERHQAGELSFRQVRIFMLDEYYGIPADNPLSFAYFMERHLLSRLHDFDRAHFHIPSGIVPTSELASQCAEYERRIATAGGIHYQLLGIGRNGHIGFNEPETRFNSRTGLNKLHDATRRDAAADFFGVANVPTHGVSMGIGTILDAERIRLVATNEGKARIIKALLEKERTDFLPASALHTHPDARVFLDEAAASELEGYTAPWRYCDSLAWDNQLIERFLTSRCLELERPLQDLSEAELEPHLGQIRDSGYAASLDAVIERAYRAIQARTCNNPGPAAGEHALVFSPHPDDAEIQLGGSIQKMLQHGVRVSVVVMTSGRLAVWDTCALPIVQDVSVLADWLGIDDHDEIRAIRNRLLREVKRASRKLGEIDSPELARIKGLIRQNEAIRGLRHLGVAAKDIHFLELPFYETGQIEKASPSEVDVESVSSILRKCRPQKVFAAGDLSDPHGTHRVCLNVLQQALQALTEGSAWHRPELLLYRGAWAEWQPHEMDVIVPLNQAELRRALEAMRFHKSQIPEAMFPGSDDRPFDLRAEQRKRHAAEIFSCLGFPMYAVEGFRRHQR